MVNLKICTLNLFFTGVMPSLLCHLESYVKEINSLDIVFASFIYITSQESQRLYHVKLYCEEGHCIFRISVLSFINANCGFKYPHVHGFEEDIPPHNHEQSSCYKNVYDAPRGDLGPVDGPRQTITPGIFPASNSRPSREHAIFVKESGALVGFIMLS